MKKLLLGFCVLAASQMALADWGVSTGPSKLEYGFASQEEACQLGAPKYFISIAPNAQIVSSIYTVWSGLDVCEIVWKEAPNHPQRVNMLHLFYRP